MGKVPRRVSRIIFFTMFSEAKVEIKHAQKEILRLNAL